MPLPQELSGEFTLRVRTADPEAVRADLQTLVHRLDPRITWTSIRRGDGQFQDEARELSSVVYVVGAAGTVALILSATGLYSVLSFLVALRRREIGVRLAIGASPSRIIALVVRQALTLVLAGMTCGLAVAVPMAFAMRATFVSKVAATDPVVYLPTIAVLLVVGVLAAAYQPFVRHGSIRSPHCGRNRNRARRVRRHPGHLSGEWTDCGRKSSEWVNGRGFRESGQGCAPRAPHSGW